MRHLKQFLLLCISGAAFAASPALAQDDTEGNWYDPWSFDGYNTARGDWYDIDGNKLASPYPFGGTHLYDEFGLNASRQYSPYERFRASIFGVVNGSDYRNPDDGFVPERINLFYENGTTEVPYRVEAGDFYAGISYRTLQRSLKGASVELQPFATQQRKHSILFFSGTNEPTYRSFDADDDYYSGASWLIEDRAWGRVSFNVVHAYQDEATPMLTGTDNSQMLYGAAVETPFDLLSQSLIFEGETSFFNGDYATVSEQSDLGVFGQLSGRSLDMPLDYRLRYERYGTDYRPNGAIIAPDRRSYEAHAGWRFEEGTYLRGRLQRFEDSFDSTNKLRTDVHGVNLSGPFLTKFVDGLTTNIDLYQQQMNDAFETVDRDTDAFNASFNMPVYEDIGGQLTAFVQDTDDRLATDADTYIKQIGFGIYAPITLWDLTGTINPGIVLREVEMDTSADSVDINPTINLTLSNEIHRISANYGLLNQNQISFAAPDVATQTAGVEYAYNFDENNELGLAGNYYDRDVDAALDTDAWRVGIYWTVRFNKPAYESGYAASSDIAGTSDVTAPELQQAGLTLMQQLAPGELLARAKTLLEEQGITGATRRTGVEIYEATLLDEVVERQRLVLEHRGGQLQKSGLVIDVTDTGSARSVEQLYERVKQKLIRQYGTPSNAYEKGEFGVSATDDINAERVIRVVEWETKNGTLRYGMPRRLDGAIRIELQHGKGFRSSRNTLWSMDLY